jgi:hypothetical protein
MIHITPRFSLRALLVVVLTCAIAAWGYWIFWPKWVAYREAVNFERMAMELRTGTNTDLFKALPNSGTLTSTQLFDSKGSPVEIYPFQLKYAWYCVYLRPSAASEKRSPLAEQGKQWDEVRVYRIEPPSPEYRAQTASGAARFTRFNPGKPSQEIERDSKEQFLADFYQIVAGHESSDLGISYELIHSDATNAAN